MIALIGSTGRIGRHVASGLHAAGAQTRALGRADLADPAALAAGLEHCERLFLLTPHGPGQEQLEATAILAAADAGVRHVVKISGAAPTLGPNGPTATAVAHWRGEQRIEHSGMGFTFLRPAFLMQNLLETIAPAVATSGVLAHPLGRGPLAMVDARDVAACAVARLLHPDPVDGAWQLTGPRAVALGDVAAALGARHRPIPPALAGRAMTRRGVSPWEVQHALRMAVFFAAGADSATTDHVQRLTGRAPRSIDDFLAEHASAFAPATALARILSRPTSKDLV